MTKFSTQTSILSAALLVSGSLLPITAHADNQLTRSRPNGKLTISFADATQPAVSFESQYASKLQSFTLPNPNRLVVDIPGDKFTGWGETISGPTGAPFERVRIASHHDKLRIVFDLIGNAKPTVKKHESTGVLALSFTGQSISRETPRILAAAPKPAIAAEEIRAALKPDMPVAHIAVPLPATSQSFSLERLEFVKLSPSDIRAIKFRLSGLPSYKIVRENETTYALRLPHTSLAAAELSHPYFPPQGFNGLTMVQAQVEDAEVVVRISVEKGTDLIAATKGNEVWVRANSASLNKAS